VQALAGHAHLATTERYAHMVATDLHEAIARLERGTGVDLSSAVPRQLLLPPRDN
jgi:hypothetical protein